VLKIINVLCFLSGRKQAVQLALNNWAPLTVLCIAQYYAVMMRGEGSRYTLLGPANPTGPWDPCILNMFFSDHTNITGIMHFFTCLSRIVCTSHIISFISLCKNLCLWRSKSFCIWCCVDCWYCCLHVQDSYWAGWIQLLLNDSRYVPINTAPISLGDFSLLQHCCDNLKCCLCNDNPTNAHLKICTITYYSSVTCFGHLRDHHQGFL